MDQATKGAALAEIANLYGRYAHALDGGDAAAFMACFAPDAGFWPNTGPFQADRGRFGGADIAGFVTKTGEGRPRHIVLNTMVEVTDATNATGAALFMLFDTTDGSIRALGRYDDRFVNAADGWRFAERRVSFLWQSPAYAQRANAIPTVET